MFLRESERSPRVVLGANSVAAGSECFGPPEVAACCPQWRVIGFVELARESQMLIGALAIAENTR